MKLKIPTNLCAGIFSVAVALIIWFAIPYQIGSAGSSVATNPRLFPQIFCVLIGIVGVVMIVSSVVFHQEDFKTVDVKLQGMKLIYYVLLAVYVVCMGKFGFLIPSVVFAVVTLLFYRCRKPLYYAIAVSFAAVLYLVFTRALGVHFPMM